MHSYHHLLLSLSTVPSIPPDLLASLDFLPHGHSHGPEPDVAAGDAGSTSVEAVGGLVDARAMYFALFSIAVKEWLYRATLRVARQQHSNVLLANAYHHRSDSLGSLVALLAIGAARVGYPMLDPVGGLVVAGMIAKQGFDVGRDSLRGLVDQVTDDEVQPAVHDAVRALSRHREAIQPWARQGAGSEHAHAPEHAETAPSGTNASDDMSASLPILDIPSIRLFASGPSLLIDLELVLPATLTLAEANAIERHCAERVRKVVGAERVREVVVRFRAEGDGEESGEGAGEVQDEASRKAQ